MFQICALYLSIDGNRVVDTIDHKRDIITLLVVSISRPSLNTAQEYYTIQYFTDPVNRVKGNITHIGLLEADEDKILVAQVSPKGSTCAENTARGNSVQNPICP